MKKSVVIVAGGKGTRMQSSTPKQFLPLIGKPVLMHTIERFLEACDSDIEIIIVLPENQKLYWKELCTQHAFTIPHQVVSGGSERFFSVKNGLEHVSHSGLVAIHDGVRPGVSSQVIKNSFHTAQLKGGCIPVIPVADSMRKVSNHESEIVNRNDFVLIQTPQTFRVKEILDAYQTEYRADFTDDASVYEYTGKKIRLIEGNKENLKITVSADINYMEWLIKKPAE